MGYSTNDNMEGPDQPHSHVRCTLLLVKRTIRIMCSVHATTHDFAERYAAFACNAPLTRMRQVLEANRETNVDDLRTLEPMSPILIT